MSGLHVNTFVYRLIVWLEHWDFVRDFFVRFIYFFCILNGLPAPEAVLDFTIPERNEVFSDIELWSPVRVTPSCMLLLQMIEKLFGHVRERPRLARTLSYPELVALLSVDADKVLCLLKLCVHSAFASFTSAAIEEPNYVYVVSDGKVT